MRGRACRFAGLAVAFWPNYSLKRTVQSLRDWSCRLAQALGLGCFASWVPGACAALHLACSPLRPPRMPFSTAADHWFGLVQAGAGTRLFTGISVASGGETSGQRGAGACRFTRKPVAFGLTSRSSGPPESPRIQSELPGGGRLAPALGPLRRGFGSIPPALLASRGSPLSRAGALASAKRRAVSRWSSSQAQARDDGHASAWHLAARHPASVISPSAGQGQFAPCRVARAPAVLA